MARRSRSKFNPLVILAAVILIVAAIIGTVIFAGGTSEPYRKYEMLDVDAYLENSNSLRGNVYRVEGEVQNDLAWSPTQGRLFSFNVTKGANATPVPILIPTSLNDINIQKGQKFIVLIEVMDNGILRAQKMTKA